MTDRAGAARMRDALVAAMLPSPGEGLPAAADLDLDGFWARFETSAPASLKAGLWAATFAVGVLPLALGYGRTLPSLTVDEREEVLQRAARLPGLGLALDVAKVVVCLAYFDDPAVDAAFRRRP